MHCERLPQMETDCCGSFWNVVAQPLKEQEKKSQLDFRFQLGKCDGYEMELREVCAKLARCGLSCRDREKYHKKVKELQESLANLQLRRNVILIPVKKVRMRSAKYDVCLRESSLRAVQAMHTRF